MKEPDCPQCLTQNCKQNESKAKKCIKSSVNNFNLFIKNSILSFFFHKFLALYFLICFSLNFIEKSLILILKFSKKVTSSKVVLLLWIFYVFSVLCLLCLCVRMFMCALWSPAGKGSVSLSLSHWYPGSGVVLDCIDS